jgi:DNA polymerase III epsilon subunit-like protein
MGKLSYRQKEIYSVLHQARELWRAGFVVLDCETTGLESWDEIIQWAITDQSGQPLGEGFIKPSPGIEISHGEQLTAAPSFAATWPTIRDLLADGKTIIAYNADFEKRMLWQSAEPHKIDIYEQILKETSWHCAMELYAQYYGDYNEHFGSYRWQKLETAIYNLKIEVPGQAHHAAHDAAATAGIIQKLAELAEKELPTGWHPPVSIKCAGCDMHKYFEYDEIPAEWYCSNCSLARGYYHYCPGCSHANSLVMLHNVVKTTDTHELCAYCNEKLEQEKMLLTGQWHRCDGQYCTWGIVKTSDLAEWCDHCKRQAEWKRQAEESERRRQERIAAERKAMKHAAQTRYREKKKAEKEENARRAAEGLPPLEKAKPPEPEREFNHNGHHLTRGKDQYERPTVTCNRCGQLWRRPPTASCLGKPTFAGWETKPENWHTMTQLRAMKMQAKEWNHPDGYVVTMKGIYNIYAISKCVPLEKKPRKTRKKADRK